jgi:hypothetical protein
MGTATIQMFAGINVSDTPLVESAVRYARQACEPYLFNHVMRSWLFATRLAEIEGLSCDGEVVAVGTLLHDITLNERFAGPRRFEIEAADLVRSFVAEAGMDDRRAQLIWDSVALNSTPSIGLYKEPEVALCTAGVCLDVVGLQYELMPQEETARIVAAYPRLDIKRRMSRCFCHIAETQPQTTYDNFARDFGERFVPGYVAPSSVDFVANAPFDE